MKTVSLLIVMGSIIGCSSPTNSTEDKSNFFNPPFDKTIGSLMEEGYTNVPEDTPILLKQSNDTTYYYQFDENHSKESKPINRYCKIPLNATPDSIVSTFLKEYGVLLLSPINKDSAFYVKNPNNNYFFTCTIELNENRNNLLIRYDYPRVE